MARSVTLASIVDRARIHADQRDKSFIDDVEALAMLNEIFPEMYDQLIDIDENYYTSETSFPIVSGTVDYALPADFYKVIGVDFATSTNGQRVTLYRFNEGERNQSFTQSSNIPNGTIYLTYVPAPVTFTALTQTLDGVSGWDRLLSLRLGIDMMDAEEGNTDRLTRKYDERLQLMTASLDRDIGMPATITDVSRPAIQSMYASIKYRLYGNNIRFVSTDCIGLSGLGGTFL